MDAPVLELDPRPGDQVADRPRDEYLARRSPSGHAGSGMDRDAANLAADDFAFPGV